MSSLICISFSLFCGRGMVTNGDSEVSFVFCVFLRLIWPLDVCYEL